MFVNINDLPSETNAMNVKYEIVTQEPKRITIPYYPYSKVIYEQKTYDARIVQTAYPNNQAAGIDDLSGDWVYLGRHYFNQWVEESQYIRIHVRPDPTFDSMPTRPTPTPTPLPYSDDGNYIIADQVRLYRVAQPVGNSGYSYSSLFTVPDRTQTILDWTQTTLDFESEQNRTKYVAISVVVPDGAGGGTVHIDYDDNRLDSLDIPTTRSEDGSHTLVTEVAANILAGINEFSFLFENSSSEYYVESIQLVDDPGEIPLPPPPESQTISFDENSGYPGSEGNPNTTLGLEAGCYSVHVNTDQTLHADARLVRKFDESLLDVHSTWDYIGFVFSNTDIGNPATFFFDDDTGYELNNGLDWHSSVGIYLPDNAEVEFQLDGTEFNDRGMEVNFEFTKSVCFDPGEPEPLPEPQEAGVTFYDQSSLIASFGTIVFDVGTYTNLDNWDSDTDEYEDGWDNDIESIEIPDGYTVTVCSDAAGTSDCQTFTSTQETLPSSLKDRISYINVSSTNTSSPSPLPSPFQININNRIEAEAYHQSYMPEGTGCAPNVCNYESPTDEDATGHLSHIAHGSTATYHINVDEEQHYQLDLRLSSGEIGGIIELYIEDGQQNRLEHVYRLVDVADGLDWTDWLTVSIPDVILLEGEQTITLKFSHETGESDRYLFNLNWLEFTPTDPTRAPTLNIVNPDGQAESQSDSHNLHIVVPSDDPTTSSIDESSIQVPIVIEWDTNPTSYSNSVCILRSPAAIGLTNQEWPSEWPAEIVVSEPGSLGEPQETGDIFLQLNTANSSIDFSTTSFFVYQLVCDGKVVDTVYIYTYPSEIYNSSPQVSDLDGETDGDGIRVSWNVEETYDDTLYTIYRQSLDAETPNNGIEILETVNTNGDNYNFIDKDVVENETYRYWIVPEIDNPLSSFAEAQVYFGPIDVTYTPLPDLAVDFIEINGNNVDVGVSNIAHGRAYGNIPIVVITYNESSGSYNAYNSCYSINLNPDEAEVFTIPIEDTDADAIFAYVNPDLAGDYPTSPDLYEAPSPIPHLPDNCSTSNIMETDYDNNVLSMYSSLPPHSSMWLSYPFNVFVFENAHLSGPDTEGSVAVGNHLRIDDRFTFSESGYVCATSDLNGNGDISTVASAYALVVGGRVTGGQAEINGQECNALIGGDIQLTQSPCTHTDGVCINGGGTIASNVGTDTVQEVVDFDMMEDHYQNLSADYLYGMYRYQQTYEQLLMEDWAHNIVGKDTNGNLILNANDYCPDNICYFDVSSDDMQHLSSGAYVDLVDIPTDSRVVINVSGEVILSQFDGSWRYNGQISSNNDLYANVLWNFTEAIYIETGEGGSWQGHLLAPYASVNCKASNLEGSIIAKTLGAVSACEIHVANYPSQP